MPLDQVTRERIRQDWGESLSARHEEFGLSKPDLLAAIVAIDDWIEANSAAFNTALSVRARSGLTPWQKAELFSLVAQARFGR